MEGRDPSRQSRPALNYSLSGVGRIRRAERAGRGIRDRSPFGVNAAGGTRRQLTAAAQPQVRLQIAQQIGCIGRKLLIDREFLQRRLELPQVINTGVSLRGGAGLYEIRNSDRRQCADEGDYEHDLDECESGVV